MKELREYTKDELIKEVEKLRNKNLIKDKKEKPGFKNKYLSDNWERVFDTISTIILLVNKEAIIVDCNKTARKYFKKPKKNLIGLNFWEVISGSDTPPEDFKLSLPKRQSRNIKINHKWFKIKTEPINDCNDIQKENIVIISDITERKNYVNEIEERRDRFADLVELANVAIASDDKDGNLVYTNKQFADLFGYTVKEIKKRSHRDLVHPDDQEMVKDIHISRFKRNKDTSRYEFRGIKKDGSTVFIDISVNEIIETNGKVVGTRSYLRDITEKKHNEWKINEQVKKIKCLQAISNVSSQKNITIDKYFDELVIILPEAFQEPNNTACYIEYKTKIYKTENFKKTKECIEITLKLKKKIVGKIKICYIGKATETSASFFTKEEKELMKTISLKISEFLERVHSELIQKIQFNIAYAVVTSENVEEFIGVIRDQLGLLIDTRNFYVALYDKDSRMLACPYMDDERDALDMWLADRSMTGYMIKQKKALLLKKKDYFKLSMLGEFDIIGELCEAWLGVPLKVKNEIIGAFVVQSYNNPDAYDENDMEVLEFVSQQISISIERKKAIEDLEIALEKAQESDRLKSAFLTNMSHEIRTPMNGILGFTKLLTKDNVDNEKSKKYLEIIDKNSRQLLSIIGDILDISKIETGQLEAFNQKLLLYDFITKLYEFYKPNFNEKNIDFSLKLNFTDNAMEIITDEGKLNQVISNLLSNALKFTSDGNVELGCILRPGNLTFYVKDSGIGIDKSFHNKIFDRFRQAELEITRQYEGNGLGLAITKGFVELLGGEIWLESELGEGATFYFTIKLNVFKSKDTNPDESDVDEVKVIDEKQYKILVVDDDDESCLYLRELLAKFPEYETVVLTSGLDAIEYVKQHSGLDIVLLDIKMPELNGYETATKLKELHPELTLIAQTAYAFYNDKQKALEVGFDDYISKPILPEDLIRMLNKHLQIGL